MSRKLSEPQAVTLRFLAQGDTYFIHAWRESNGAFGYIVACRESEGLIHESWKVTRTTLGALIGRGYIERRHYPMDDIEHWYITEAGRKALEGMGR